ncbi:hypothetical protein [Candidatus Venteria ishoeyi]|uniref:Uncharacterized protein n=1 Tax=Candidatus Venteria ishoeyi TaxID=1899563 RepID=A0A1H6F7R9_9GAMM|nr:hypothetical protein [Candidatus Venteria ishoeyi]SEH06178.1 Uncharacterised protein [Candidatus Venteria ishoeyi]
MAMALTDMTKQEFEEFFSDLLERKLLELLVDPDKGLLLQERLQERLLRQQKTTAQGQRGRSFEDVAAQLGL